MIIWSVLSAATIGAIVTLFVLPFSKKRLSFIQLAITIAAICVVYHAVAFAVMVSGGTPFKPLNAVLVFSILPAWGLGAPKGDMSWTLLLSFSFQIAVATAIGTGLYIIKKIKDYANKVQEDTR